MNLKYRPLGPFISSQIVLVVGEHSTQELGDIVIFLYPIIAMPMYWLEFEGFLLVPSDDQSKYYIFYRRISHHHVLCSKTIAQISKNLQENGFENFVHNKDIVISNEVIFYIKLCLSN
jgi:hypothetical protein